MRHYNRTMLTFLAAMAALTACRMESASFSLEGPSSVSASAAYVTDTKAALTTAVPETFTLYACSYSGSVPTGIDYIYGETMTKSDSKWVSANKFKKVSSDKTVKYFAVHPSDATGLVLPEADAAGAPVFGYTLPSGTSDQADIIVASHDYSGSQENITLAFGHALAAVTFKFASGGAFDGTIKTLAVKGVSTKGDYTLGAGWSNLSTPGAVTQTVNGAFTSASGGADISTSAAAMLLIPQTVGGDAVLVATVNDGTKDVTLECSLSGEAFTAGKKYAVALDFSEIGAKLLTIESVTITDWVNVASQQTPERKSEPVFTVDDKGTQVTFSPGNLYWDGSQFKFEEHQYDYPTSWNASHVGHFKWAATIEDAVKGDNTTPSGSSFFATDGGAVAGYTALTKDEWDYVITNHLGKNKVTIAGKECIVLTPDTFSGTIANSYTADAWILAEAQYGLVALPFAGARNGTNINSFGITGCYWSTTLIDDSGAYCGYFNTTQAYTDNGSRFAGGSLRLVKPVGISATYSVSNQTEVTLPAATFAAGTVAAIDWGDGDAEVKARPSGGDVTLKHTYASAYMGKVKINVKEGCVDFGAIKQEYFDNMVVYDGTKVKKELLPELVSLTLNVDALRNGLSSNVSLMAEYDNGTSQDVTALAEWEYDGGKLVLSGNTFTASGSGATDIYATFSYGGQEYRRGGEYSISDFSGLYMDCGDGRNYMYFTANISYIRQKSMSGCVKAEWADGYSMAVSGYTVTNVGSGISVSGNTVTSNGTAGNSSFRINWNGKTAKVNTYAEYLTLTISCKDTYSCGEEVWIFAIYQGSSLQFWVDELPGTRTWTTSNSCASIYSSGSSDLMLISSYKKGECTITLNHEGNTASKTITVQ